MGSCKSKKCEYTNLKNETPQPPPPEYDECENNTNLNQLNKLINHVKKIENKLTYFIRNHSWLSANRNLYAYFQLQVSNTDQMILARNYLHDHEIEKYCDNIIQTAKLLKNEKNMKQPCTLVNGLYKPL
jgi:hypothetical protein